MVYMRNGFALVSVGEDQVSEWEKSGWVIDDNQSQPTSDPDCKPKTRRRKTSVDTNE